MLLWYLMPCFSYLQFISNSFLLVFPFPRSYCPLPSSSSSSSSLRPFLLLPRGSDGRADTELHWVSQVKMTISGDFMSAIFCLPFLAYTFSYHLHICCRYGWGKGGTEGTGAGKETETEREGTERDRDRALEQTKKKKRKKKEKKKPRHLHISHFPFTLNSPIFPSSGRGRRACQTYAPPQGLPQGNYVQLRAVLRRLGAAPDEYRRVAGGRGGGGSEAPRVACIGGVSSGGDGDVAEMRGCRWGLSEGQWRSLLHLPLPPAVCVPEDESVWPTRDGFIYLLYPVTYVFPLVASLLLNVLFIHSPIYLRCRTILFTDFMFALKL